MVKLKYIFLLIIIFTFTSKAQALDIQYGNIKGYTNTDVLIEYYGIGKKNNYICNITSLKCTSTKKTTIGKPNNQILKNLIKQELKEVNGNHAIMSKNSRFLAYYISAKEPENKRSYIIKNIKENINYKISESVSYWDLIDEYSKVFEFSPDEKTLLYLDDKDNNTSIYKVDTDNLKNNSFENIKIVTTATNIATFTFFDSSNIYYVGNTKENPYIWSLYHLDLKTGKDKIIESYVSYVDKITKVGNYLFFISQQEKGYGPEIYNTKTKKISYLKIPNINTKKNIKNEEFLKVGISNGVVMTPLSYDKTKVYPLVIWLHGGPLRQTSLGYHPYHSYGMYDAMLKLLQKNNVIVLKLDYRGSFGVGRKYSESIKESVGKGDIEDVMEATKYMKNQYKISDTYLAGNSYGGYMSLKSIVEYPDTFKGIFSINGVTDWESLLVKMQTSIFNTHFNGLPNNTNRSLYDQASIINKISNLENQRIEIIQGEADRTVPLWQATLLNGKLKDANKNVNLTTYKGEDHVFANKKNIGNVCVKLFGLLNIQADKECTK